MVTYERMPAVDERAPAPLVERGTGPSVALVASTLLVTMEALRTLYPLGYSLVGDLGFIVTPAVLLLVFLSPLLVPLARAAGGRTRLIVAVAAVAVARAVLQLLAPPPLWAAMVATVIALVAVTVVLAAVLDHPGGAVAVALGFTIAMGADATLKGSFAAWDRVWQPGLGPLLVTLAVCAALLASLVHTVRTGTVADGEARRGRVARSCTVTVLLMPAMTMLGSVAFVTSASERSLPTAALATIAGGALAVMATGLAARAHIGRRGGFVAAAGLGLTVWLMTSIAGAGILLLAAAGQGLTGVLLVAVLRDEPRSHTTPTLRCTALGAALGFVAMFVLTLLYPFHYEMPLPITNTVLPVVAVGIAALGLLGRRDVGVRADGGVDMHTLLAGAGGLALAGAVVAIGLSMTEHDPVALHEATFPLTVASYNTDQSATPGGAVDFRAAADQIATLDADVVALQEVARGWSLSGMNDFAAWLQHTRGTVQHFAPAADGQFGNLLITRVVLAAVRTISLPKGVGSMARSAVVADIATPDGQATVIAVHLQHRNSAGSIAARRDELQVVLDLWAGAPRTIVLGDFNADNQRSPQGGPKLLVSPGHENTLQPLLDAGFTTTQATDRCTMPTSNDNCSDFVLVTPDLAQDPPVQVFPDAAVGDHRPIRATIQLR